MTTATKTASEASDIIEAEDKDNIARQALSVVLFTPRQVRRGVTYSGSKISGFFKDHKSQIARGTVWTLGTVVGLAITIVTAYALVAFMGLVYTASPMLFWALAVLAALQVIALMIMWGARMIANTVAEPLNMNSVFESFTPPTAAL